MKKKEELALANKAIRLEEGVGVLMGKGSIGQDYFGPTIFCGIQSSMNGEDEEYSLDEVEEKVLADVESKVIWRKASKGEGEQAVFYGTANYRHKFLPKESFKPKFPLYAFFRAYVLDYFAEFRESKNEVFATLFPPVKAVDVAILKEGLQSETPPKWLNTWPYVPLTSKYKAECAKFSVLCFPPSNMVSCGDIATAAEFALWRANEELEMEQATPKEYIAKGEQLPEDIAPAKIPLPTGDEDGGNPPTQCVSEPLLDDVSRNQVQVAKDELIISGSITVGMIRRLLDPDYPRFSKELDSCVKVWCSFELPEDKDGEKSPRGNFLSGPVPLNNTAREAVGERMEVLYYKNYGVEINYNKKNSPGERLAIVTNWDKKGYRKK